MDKRKRIESILCCPLCKGDLRFEPDSCVCDSCQETYPVKDGKFFFREAGPIEAELQDSLDQWKYKFKGFSGLYRFLVKVISPVYFPDAMTRKIIENKSIRVEIGAGNSPFCAEFINCDYFAYDHIDVVLDAASLPLKSNSVDLAINMALLEHVPQPSNAVNEIYRVLCDRGEVFSTIPFMQPFHASPHDYQRYTLPGIRRLYGRFQEIQSGVYSGPVSGFLWVFLEFLALVFSLGSNRLHHCILLSLVLLTFPIKYADILLMKLKIAENLASSFYFHGIKTEAEAEHASA